MGSGSGTPGFRKSISAVYDGSLYGKLGFIKGIFFVGMVVFLIFRFIVGTSTVSGKSMYPTLKNGQRVFFVRIQPEYNIGDIVSFRMPSGEYYVKRIIAKEGDIVSVSDGKMFVNGKALDEPYARGATKPQEETVVYPYTVGKDAYFCVGDNREHSIDSRSFGAIVKYQIRGRILGN